MKRWVGFAAIAMVALALAPGSGSAAPESAATAEVLRLRSEFGLPTDAETLRLADLDTKRVLDGAPGGSSRALDFPIPLTAAERAAFQRYNELPSALEPLRAAMLKRNDVTADFILNARPMTPGLAVQVTDAASSELIDELATLMPAGVGLSIERVKVSALTRDRAKEFLTAQFAEWGAGTAKAESNFFGRLATRDVVVDVVSYDPATQTVELRVDAPPDSERQSLALSYALELPGTTSALPLEIGLKILSSPRPRAASRDNDPGQPKGGLRITANTNCTSNVSLASADGLFVLTAGHCMPNSTTWSHSGAPWGQTRWHTWTNGSNADAGLIQVSTGGMVSEYTHIQGFWNGVLDDQIRISGQQLAAMGSAVCQEGATNKVPFGSPVSSCGTVDRVGWSISYNQTTVTINGMIGATAQTCPGDSGGVVRIGNSVTGIVGVQAGAPVGGPDSCSDYLWFTPISNAINALSSGHAPLTIVASPGVGSPASYGLLAAAHSGLCLDANWPTTNGTTLYQYGCHGQGPQQFVLAPKEGTGRDDDYTIRRAINPGVCIEVDTTGPGGGWSDGAAIRQWSCDGSVKQDFLLQRSGSTNSYFVRTASYGNRCFDVYGASLGNLGPVVSWSCHFGNNQRWNWR